MIVDDTGRVVVEPRPSPRCPIHGFVMTQDHDIRRVNDMLDVAIPNGKFSCYRCDVERDEATR